MSFQSGAPPYYYIAYIDESGDPNLERVRPRDNPGSAEWLILGAVLIEASDELAPVEWVRSILQAAQSRQPALHYRNLWDWQKPLVCTGLGKCPAKLFAVTSNKKNMRQHRNERAEKSSLMSPAQTFYNWCTRLLLERVTHCVLAHSMRKYGEPRFLKVIFSKRNTHSYGHAFAYQELLKAQSRSGTAFLAKRAPRWEVMDYHLLEVQQHEELAGLQLADIVASAFYQAVDVLPPTLFDPRNAQRLSPRMARYRGSVENYGLAFLPWKYYEAELLPDQIDIFEFYGFHRFDFHAR